MHNAFSGRRRGWWAGAAVGVAVALMAAAVGNGSPVAGESHQVGPAAATSSPKCTAGYQPRPGFRLDVCVALNGSAVTPSVNVTGVGSTGTSCSIVLEVWDDANNRLDRSDAADHLSCRTGKVTGAVLDLDGLQGVTAHASPNGSLTVHAFARLYVDGKGVYIPGQGNSPTVTATPTGTPPSGSGKAGIPGRPLPAHNSPASMTGPAGQRDIPTMTAKQVDSFFNNIGSTLDQTAGIVCYTGVLTAVIPCTASPEAFLLAVNTAAKDAKVDPRLLLTIMVGERGAHWQVVPHSTPAEFARWLLSLTGAVHSLGMTNMSKDAFRDAQLAAGPNSDLARHSWTDLIGNPILAIDAAAWLLHGLKDKLPPTWPAQYKRDQLLAVGYNGGSSVMTGVAGGLTPDQADPKNPGKVASYLVELSKNWDGVDSLYCHSGTFTCSM